MLTFSESEVAAVLRRISAEAFPELRPRPFSLEVQAKESLSRHGDWTWGPSMERPRIRIFNLARPTQTIVKTAIHELAHHVDWCGRGKTGHDKEFYRIYKALLEAAHALGEIDLSKSASGSTEADLEAERDVRRALSLQGPFRLRVCAEAASWFVRVGDGFAAKDALKSAGFSYSPTERAWIVEAGDETQAQALEAAALSFGGKSVSKGLAKGREIESVYFVLCGLRKADPRSAELRSAGLWWRDGDGWCAKLPAAEALKKAGELAKMGIPCRCAPSLPSKAAPKAMAASKRSS